MKSRIEAIDQFEAGVVLDKCTFISSSGDIKHANEENPGMWQPQVAESQCTRDRTTANHFVTTSAQHHMAVCI